jgi:hypothetical protein
MKYKLIPWRGACYHAVELTLFPGTDREEEVTIATVTLEDELLDEARNLRGEEASDLDDTIVYYVAPDEIKLPEEQIRKIVENALSQ